MPLAPEVAKTISGFSPRTVAPEAVVFARELVAAACPPNRARAKALLFAASRLGAFGLRCGLGLSPERLLEQSVIERFCAIGLTAMTPATVRTVRANLRWVASRVLPPRAPTTSISRERAKAPYSARQIAAYLALCDTQPTEARRHHASALVCLGAGAGLMGGDLRHVRGTDVVGRFGGLLVCVHGARPRVIPVRAEFHGRLLGAACFAGERYVIGGSDPGRRNITTPLLRAMGASSDLPPLDTGRLRSTWLAACAADLGIKAFLDAAGVRCTQRLGDIVSQLEAIDEELAVALLGGRR